jgi:hypothetical protein
MKYEALAPEANNMATLSPAMNDERRDTTISRSGVL